MLQEERLKALLMQLARSEDAKIQCEDIEALGSLVHSNEANQTAAASAGAVELLMQLARSDDAALKFASIKALGCLVYEHEGNQTAAASAGAIELLMQFAECIETCIMKHM